jgi:polyisoprenoid-binding protein YceI
MKNWILAWALCGLVSAEELRPRAGDWIRLEVAKTGLMRGKKHVFAFPSYQGTVNVAQPSFTLSLESARIVLEDDWLKESDRKKVLDFTLRDMLDAGKHPQIQYRSTQIQRQEGGGLVQGLLKIRGIEKPVEVRIRDLGNNLFEGSSRFDMRHFGLKPPTAAFGAIGTDPMLELRFRLTLR